MNPGFAICLVCWLDNPASLLASQPALCRDTDARGLSPLPRASLSLVLPPKPRYYGKGIFAMESGLHAFLIMHTSRSFQLKHSFPLLSSGLGEKMKKERRPGGLGGRTRDSDALVRGRRQQTSIPAEVRSGSRETGCQVSRPSRWQNQGSQQRGCNRRQHGIGQLVEIEGTQPISGLSQGTPLSFPPSARSSALKLPSLAMSLLCKASCAGADFLDCVPVILA